jgi:hypothetical protein
VKPDPAGDGKTTILRWLPGRATHGGRRVEGIGATEPHSPTTLSLSLTTLIASSQRSGGERPLRFRRGETRRLSGGR